MGVDIKLFLEIDERKSTAQPWSTPTLTNGVFVSGWEICSFSRHSYLDIKRDHKLFHALAGSMLDRVVAPLIPPRGFPACISESLAENINTRIADEKLAVTPHVDTVTSSYAELLVRKGEVKYMSYDNGQTWPSITAPGLVRPSWLLLSEVFSVLEHHNLDIAKLQPAFKALLATMQSFENDLGTGRTRLTFYFDSLL